MTTTNTANPTGGDPQTALESRGLLVAVESAISEQETPVTTNEDVARRVFDREAPTRVQEGLVGDALARLTQEGFVGHDRIARHDVWFAPNVEAFDEATSDDAEGRGRGRAE